MPTGETWAVVVARTGRTAKSRLAGALSPRQRAALAVAMLSDVLAACAQARLAGTLVVTDTAAGAAVARRHRATWMPDPGGGLNAAVSLGLGRAAAAGAGTALVLPGDVPLIAPLDVDAIVEAAGQAARAVLVVPDRVGTGTNALLVRPPTLIEPAFGDGSCERHLLAGRRVGALVRRLARPRVALDVDTPGDLVALGDRYPRVLEAGRWLATRGDERAVASPSGVRLGSPSGRRDGSPSRVRPSAGRE